MTADAPCGSSTCPVPPPAHAVLRRVRTTIIDAGTPLWRGHRTDDAPDGWAPAVDTPAAATSGGRWTPVVGHGHTYLAQSQQAALLESVLRDLDPHMPLVPWHLLDRWAVTKMTLRTPVRVIDLRDPELDRLGLDRGALIGVGSRHYACTRRWATALRGRVVGGQPTAGLVWHSRQMGVHERSRYRPVSQAAFADPLGLSYVLWTSADSGSFRASVIGPDATVTLHVGRGRALVEDLANILGAPPALTSDR